MIGLRTSLGCGLLTSLVGGLTSASGGAKAILLIGQSPMSGYDTAAALTGANIPLAAAFSPVPTIYQRTTRQDPIVWSYYSGDTANDPITTGPSTFGTVSPHFYSGVASDCVGPEISLARDLDSVAPGQFRLVKMSVDGSCLATDWLNPAYPTGGPSLATQLTNFVTAANVTIVGIHWEQGHNDAILTANASAYAANLAIWFAQLRANYGNVPITFGQLMAGVTTSPYTFRDVIRAQQVIASQSIPYVTLINDDDLTLKADVIHPNADGSIAIGHRIATAYQAAIVNTTLTATLTSSANPIIANGSPYNYLVNVTNAGAVAAGVVSARVTLGAGIGYTSATGTGWTCTQAAGVVTCTRPSGVVGALPTITIAVTSPSAFGTGSVVSTATVVATNVQALTSLTHTETLTAPSVTKDSTSLVYTPLTATEFSAFITQFTLKGVDASTALAVPTSAYFPGSVSSGVTLPDAIGAFPLTFSGLNVTFAQAVAGWSTPSAHWINGATGTWKSTDAALPAMNTTASTVVMFCAPVSASATRVIVATGTTTQDSIQFTATPKINAADGGNSALGTAIPTAGNGVRCLTQTHDPVGLTARVYTDQEKLVPTFSSVVTGKSFQIGGGVGGGTAPVMDVIAVYRWDGASAAITDANMKALITALGNGLWAPP